MSKLSINVLTEEPYGPYPDDRILSSDFPGNGFIPSLSSVELWCDDEQIGFDQSEFIIRPPENSLVAKYPVHVYGILEIKSLNWLSDQGKAWLEYDLRERDMKHHWSISASNLTLQSLYGFRKGEGSRISVILKLDKNMLAQFKTEPKHPNAFLIHTKYRNCVYEVKSLDIITQEKSNNFLERFRQWALIDEIITVDKGKTPVEHRTIDWLIEQYLSPTFRNRDLYRRIIFDHEHHSDVDEKGRTTKRRHLRHIHRSEIRGMFAEQAEWLLAYMLAPNHRNLWKINVMEWIRFCRLVKKTRLAAMKEGVRWGVPYDGHVDPNDRSGDINLAQFGESREFWSNKIKGVMRKEIERPKKRQRQVLSDSEDNFPAKTRMRAPPRTYRFIYDADFSEPSTDGESDSEPPEPLIRASRIPSFCWEPPTIPNGRMIWDCPGCQYKINMLDLSGENAEGIAQDAMTILQAKKWGSIRDSGIWEVFSHMVHVHYEKHLKEVGLQVTRKEGGRYVVEPWVGGWTAPVNVRRSKRKVKRHAKVEEMSQRASQK